MYKIKTKWFNRWAKKNNITDFELIRSLKDVENNLGTVKLGNGLYKIRVGKKGQGKSGSIRTILVYKKDNIALYVYGFTKNERDNILQEELLNFKALAKTVLKMSQTDIQKQLKEKLFFKMED